MRRIQKLSMFLAAACVVAGCKPEAQQADAAAGPEIPVRAVRVVQVGTGDLVESVSLVGELQGIEEVRVFAQVADRIRTLVVKEGDIVKGGDVLATVNADIHSSAVNQAQAAMEAAIANRDAVHDNLERTRQLAAAGSASRSQLQTLEAQARAAEAQVRQATAGLGQASAQRSRTVIRAPISGVVSQINLREGDLAAPGAPIMTIVRDHRLKAVFRAPERDFLRITEGMNVKVRLLANDATSVDAKVSLRGPVVDRMTRTGLVEVHIDNAEHRLMAGAAVRGTIELSRRPDVVLVPAEAIMLSGETERTGRATAFLTDGKVAKRRDVKVGVRQDGAIEIVEGLSRGDSLIVQGAHFLRDENPIRVMTDGASGEKK